MLSTVSLLILLFINLARTQYQGDECTFKDTGKKGLCKHILDCDGALGLVKSNKKPQRCEEFIGDYPVVCCPVGELSELKCSIYHPQGTVLAVAGGEKALSQEFPHMAVLGYGEKNNIKWSCGGSLISEEYVLTAAHCISDRTFGTVRWIRLGDLDILDTKDDAAPQDFVVKETTIHPNYKKASHYHDVALVKLDKKAQFTEYVQPACLHVTEDVPDQLIVTGWGKVDFLGDPSSHLLKATLNRVDHQTCSNSYSSVSERKLANGISEETQLCAGHPDGKDTCPGDSGGPLQFKQGLPSYYRIVGITSFGKACGLENSIGVYTKVSNYFRWIEDIVWPQK